MLRNLRWGILQVFKQKHREEAAQDQRRAEDDVFDEAEGAALADYF